MGEGVIVISRFKLNEGVTFACFISPLVVQVLFICPFNKGEDLDNNPKLFHGEIMLQCFGL